MMAYFSEYVPGQPVVFLMSQQLPTVHLQRPDRIPDRSHRVADHTGAWILSAEPLPWELPVVHAYQSGLFPWYKLNWRLRKAPSLRLLFRAVQTARSGRRFRASQLAEMAVDAMWNGHYDADIWCLIKGFQLDLLTEPHETPEPTSVIWIWRAQADWWAGGKWEEGGKLGSEIRRLTLENMAGAFKKERKRARRSGGGRGGGQPGVKGA